MIVAVTKSQWDALPKIERDMLVCAMESTGILPYAVQHDTEIDSGERAAASARAVLTLVDRGWVTVHRLIPDPDGHHGIVYGPAIARADLEDLLAGADIWDDPSDERWHGELTVGLTEAGLAVARE
jgi:hypothetical protein